MPELVRGGDPVFRQAIVGRRTVSYHALSSGQHSLTGGRQIPKSPTPLRRTLTGGRRQLPLGFVSPEQTRAWNSYLRRALVRRRTGCESALSSGQHSLAGGRRIPKSPTPLRGALTGGRHQLLLGFASPEQAKVWNSYLRRALVRRRTGCESTLSSGQHSLVGGRQIPKSSTPLRGALTGGRHQLLLGFASPELVQAQNAHLRRAFVRRRIGSESARSSGQHSIAGGGRLPAPHLR